MRPGGENEMRIARATKGIPKSPSIADGKVFAGCTDRERVELDRLATVVTVPAARLLTRQGQRGLEFGVILDGEAIVEIDGREVARLGAGDHYGELALLDQPGQGPGRRATVRTLTETSVAAMTVPEFRAALANFPDVANRVMSSAWQRAASPTS